MNTPPIIILVHPQMGENIGAAARVMANFGLSELRVVKPRQRWPNKKAIAMATHAHAIVESAERYPTLELALADTVAAYALTVRTRDMLKSAYSSLDLPQIAQPGKWALVFGPENNGLDNQMISLCSGTITVPTMANFGSMNLAQAVCVMAYEWQRLAQTAPIAAESFSDPATFQEVDACAEHLTTILDQHNYFRAPDKRPGMITALKNLFHNNRWTTQQVRTWRGIWRALGRDN